MIKMYYISFIFLTYISTIDTCLTMFQVGNNILLLYCLNILSVSQPQSIFSARSQARDEFRNDINVDLKCCSKVSKIYFMDLFFGISLEKKKMLVISRYFF